MSKEWNISPPWPECESQARAWQVHPLIAQLLYNRGLDGSNYRAFLQPQMTDLLDPQTLPGAMAAAEYIVGALHQQQKIVLYGDYDVDGITGTAMLWHLLSLAGGHVDWYVPHRLEEGYGINVESIHKLQQDGARLIISVDCGITAHAAAAQARELGMELIITDHHTPQSELPDCRQIVHPTALGPSPNPHLCGAGVAFKLAWAVAQKLSNSAKVSSSLREFLLNVLGLAALGTIADVVPLIGENRIIARFGLAGLPNNSIVGLQALIESAGLTGSKINAYDVGFKLAPRLNAAGRMGHARLALELLTRADATRAGEIARYLEEQNRARQSLERKIVAQARDMVRHQEMDRPGCRAIVLADENWHAGVIGIVASRLVDEFHRPTVLVSLANGVGQGSARSVRHFELDLALQQCREFLLSFGGHRMAAGLKIATLQLPAFREAFITQANNRLTAADLQARLELEAEIPLRTLDEQTVRTIQEMRPFGMGNPTPRLASDWLELVGEPRLVGASKDHLQFSVTDGQVQRRAIGFGLGSLMQELRDHRRCRVAFEPIINDFRGFPAVELQALDLQFPQ
ncbi:MAG: Single-stranded-DNA-specific exonuclease RecJ [Phycisphaerae bacterium]|nr:Single-stranded-DNA-specific exonuclease RecJ [Phycisphaerae bacterium]